MIDINCDMGEGFGNEALLMPFINSANIACGYHAGDETTMNTVVQLCLQHGVNIGAHPSFRDKANFGRTAMQVSLIEIYTLVTEQLHLLDAITKKHGGNMHHVKPHGALYNMAAKDAGIAHSIARAVKNFDPSLVYYGLSGSVMIAMAAEEGLEYANEVFADRTYLEDGALTPRLATNALINDVDEMLKQATTLAKENSVITVTGKKINLKADTICIHGDGEHALEFAKTLYQHLQ